MPQAKITINAVAGSNDDLPINTLVQLNNVNNGGEITYLWTILSQPPGPSDLLSSTTVQNPSFTPKKEGTYRIKLTVNLGLATEQSDDQIVGIRLLKSRNRLPAPGETIEDGVVGGWAEPAMNTILRGDDALLSNPPPFVGLNESGGPLSAGTVVQVTSNPTIKTGLPGQEVVPGFVTAPATTLANVDSLLGVVISDVFGSGTVASGALMVVRYIGRVANGLPAVATAGTPVYVSNTATLSTTPGTIQRQIGTVMGAGTGGNSDVWLDAVGGFEITPINAPYVVFGSPGTLTNAFRIDGGNATALAGAPARFKADAGGTFSALQAQAAAGQTADIFQALSSTASPLMGVDPSGNVVFKSAGIGNTWPHWTFLESGGGTLQATHTSAVTFSATWLNNAAHGAILALSAVPSVQFGSASGTNDPIEFMVNGARTWMIGTGATAALQPVGGNGTFLFSNNDTPVASYGSTLSGIAASDGGLHLTGIAGATASPGGAGGVGGDTFGAVGGNGLNPGDAGGNAGYGFKGTGATGGAGNGPGDQPGNGGNGLWGIAGQIGGGTAAPGNTNAYGVRGDALNVSAIGSGIPGTAGVGAFGFSGVTSSGIPSNPGLIVGNGNAWFSGSNPTATSANGFKNTQTPKNMLKASAYVTTDGAGGVTLVDGFNMGTPTVSSSGVTINFAAPFADTHYTIGYMPETTNAPMYLVLSANKHTGSAVVTAVSSSFTTLDPTANAIAFTVNFFGAQ